VSETFVRKDVNKNGDRVLILLYAYMHRKLLNYTSRKYRQLLIKLLI